MLDQSIFPPVDVFSLLNEYRRQIEFQKSLDNFNTGSSLNALEKLVANRTNQKEPESINDNRKVIEERVAAMPSRNRYGRPYISGRPLLTCDRIKILECYKKGMKKIHIAKELGITHSCVSKVLRRFAETGEIGARACRTASCSCPGYSNQHDKRYCKHLQGIPQRRLFTIENILREERIKVIYYSKIE